EAQLIRKAARLHIDALDICDRDVRLAVGHHDAGVNHHSKDHVEHHARYDHDDALPYGLGPELPGFGLLGQLFGIHALVDHPRYLDVATQRRRRYAVVGLADLFPENPWREAYRKAFHTHAEELSGEKMPQFVYEN